MKLIKIYLPEIVPFIIFPILYYFNSRFFDFIANTLFVKDGGNWKLLALLNITPLAISLKYLKDTLLPKTDNKVLLNWPIYDKFKLVVLSVFILTLISSVITIIFFISNEFFIESIIGLIYTTITISSLISLFTLILASFQVRIVLEKYL